MKKFVYWPVLASFVFSIAYSQEKMVQNFSTNSCAVVKRLDTKGEVYENTKLQNQGNLSTCYANTASMSLLGFYNKEHPESKINQLSWLHLAFMTQKDHLTKIDDGFYENNHKLASEVFARGGRLCPLYESVKGKKLCELKSDFYDEASFKKNLESNPETLVKVINDFEDLLSIDEFYQNMQKPNQRVMSPSCIERIDRNLDKKIAQLITPKLDESLFEEIYSLKNPDIGIEEFYQGLKEKFIIDNFSKKANGNNMLSANKVMELETYPRFSINTSDPEDIKDIRHLFNKEALDSSMYLSSDAIDKLYNVGNKIRDLFQPIFNQIHQESKKDLIECVNQTLNGVDEILISLGAQEGTCRTSNVSEKIANTYIELLSRGFNPDYLVKLLNSKDLYTRESLFEEMMVSLYDNCEVEVPTDLKCDFWQRGDISEGHTPSELVFTAAKDQIDNQGVSAYVAFKYDFNRSPSELKRNEESTNLRIKDLNSRLAMTHDENEKAQIQNEISSLKENNYTHALSIIGYSEGCGEEKRNCVLIQNSFGDEFSSNEEEYYSSSIIPDKERVENYDGTEFRMKSYGKFWLCDEELINKNFESFARLRK